MSLRKRGARRAGILAAVNTAVPAPGVPPGPEHEPSPLALLLDPRGRISRRGFWLWGVAALFGLAILLHALLAIARVREHSAEQIVAALLAWPALAVSIKRWHDRDYAGWWVLLGLVPVVGWIATLVVNGFLPGTPGPNRYGPAPRR